MTIDARHDLAPVAARPEFEIEPTEAVTIGDVERPLSVVERILGNELVQRLAILLALIAIWQVYALWLNNSLLFPTFTETIATFWHDMRNGELVDRTVTSLRTLAIGYAFGLVIAGVMTTFAVASGIGTRILSTLTAMFNPLPAIALLPLALIWFGLGTPSLVFVIIHSVLWAVALNTLSGFRSVPETLRMSGRNVGLKGARYVALILIPAAFPSILAGLKIGWAFAWRTLVAAELVFGVSARSGGIGWYIFEARNDLDTATVFSGLLTVILIGLAGRIGDFPFHRGAHGQSLGHAAMTVTAASAGATLEVKVWRGAETGEFQSFAIPRREHQTVLDVVTEIQREHDSTLSYRFACRVGMCGSCAMVVNGRPRWTCRTRVSEVIENGKLQLEPLRNLRGGQGPRGRDGHVLRQVEGRQGLFRARRQAGERFRRRAAVDAGAAGRQCRHRMHRLRRVLFGLRRGGLGRGLSRTGRAQPRLDAGQRRARPRTGRADDGGVRRRRLSRLPHPYELHRVLPEGHRAHLFDRGPQARDAAARVARWRHERAFCSWRSGCPPSCWRSRSPCISVPSSMPCAAA